MFSARPGQRPRWSWLDTEPRGYLMVLKLAGWNHQGTVGGSALVPPRAPEASISPLELLGAGGSHPLPEPGIPDCLLGPPAQSQPRTPVPEAHSGAGTGRTGLRAKVQDPVQPRASHLAWGKQSTS